MRVILASTSPRRKELLALLGVPFDIVEPSFVERVVPNLPAERQAMEFAAGKARSCAAEHPEALIIGSDTLISLGHEVLGKPRDLAEAEAMLAKLAGRTHRIYTAVALVGPVSEPLEVRVATVRVTMKPFEQEALAGYLRTGESLGKAGAYSIQGEARALIERIDGDYTAAVGLPLRLTAEMLVRRGLSCSVDIDRLYARQPYPNWSHFAASPIRS